MAEILTVVPAAIAIIQIIDRLGGFCKHFISSYRDAPEDLRALLLETSSLKALLEDLIFLRKCDDQDSASSNARLETLEHSCSSLLGQFENLLCPDRSEGHHHQVKLCKIPTNVRNLAWPLRQNKARKILDRLRMIKDAIHLELTTQSR